MNSAFHPDDLVLCGATVFDAPLEQKIALASAGGFRGITLWLHDYAQARERGITDADIRHMLGAHGLKVAGIDCLLDWLPGDQVPDMPVFRAREEDLYRVADAVGAEFINVAQAFGSSVDVAQAADLLGAICGRAAARQLDVTLEFIPWSGIRDLATANAIVGATGMRNARIAIDAWHFFRGGSSFEELRRTPGERLANIQLNDGPAQPWPDITAEASDRLLPGDGELPLEALINAIRATGFSGPWGIEAPSSRWSTLQAEEIGRLCGAAMRRVLHGNTSNTSNTSNN
jgi:sugar phosphate isomerase/epimerase